VEAKLWDVIRDDPRYSYEAHEFLCDAVSFTQETLDRAPQESDEPDADFHIDAEELCRGTCELAMLEFGMMAPIVFQQWGIRTTDDIGEIVYHLIQAGKLCQADGDDITDFHNLFHLDEALTHGFEIILAQPRKGVR
jgi:uncharacterized repeat protein (TIGR04138 family)